MLPASESDRLGGIRSALGGLGPTVPGGRDGTVRPRMWLRLFGDVLFGDLLADLVHVEFADLAEQIVEC